MEHKWMKRISFFLALVMVLTMLPVTALAETLSPAPQSEEPQSGEEYVVALTAEDGGRVSGGGVYADGQEVTVTAHPAEDYEFTGWYDNGALVSPTPVYSFTALGPVSYQACFTSTVDNYALTVKGTENYTITDESGEPLTASAIPANTSVTLTFTDEAKAFLYWVNDNGNILSTEPGYTFTMVRNTAVTAKFAEKNTDSVRVVFRNAYAQIVGDDNYSKSAETITVTQPVTPVQMGHTFAGWYLAGADGKITDTPATNVNILAAIQDGTPVVVLPKYVPNGATYSATVTFQGVTRDSETYDDIPVGEKKNLRVPAEIDGQKFRCWKMDDEIVGYDVIYSVLRAQAGTVALTAVYGDAVDLEPIVNITQTYATISGEKYVISNTMQYYVPMDGAQVIETGFVYGTSSAQFGNQAETNLVLDGAKTYRSVSGSTAIRGLYTFNGRLTKPTTTLYIKAYIIYKTAEDEIVTRYSALVSGSYYDFGNVASVKEEDNGGKTTTATVVVTQRQTDTVAATATVPQGVKLENNVAVSNGTVALTVTTEKTVDTNPNNIEMENQETANYDVSIVGVSSENETPIVVCLQKALPLGLVSVSAYHSGVSMEYRNTANLTEKDTYYYDPATGDVYICVTHFSNFTFGFVKATAVVDTTPAAISGLTYNGEAQALVTAGTATGGTMQYKLGDGQWNDSVPTATAAGKYTVYYKVVGDANHNDSAADSVDVTIAKAANSITSLSITGWTYGDNANAPTATAAFGTIDYTYSNSQNGKFTDDVPINAGTWYVKAAVEGNDNYDAADDVISFTIAKASITPAVTLSDRTYGEAAKTPTVTGNTGNGAVTYYYKAQGADDSTYTDTVPTAAGTYTVKAVIAETANYNNAEATTNFTITKAPATFSHSEAFINVDKYLYRVGNRNEVNLGNLFAVVNNGGAPVVSADVIVTATPADNDIEVSGTYTPHASDWTQSTLQFTGEGPVRVTIREGSGAEYTLNLEVVDAINATSATSATSNNVVLLNNVSGGLSVSNGYTLYGNGFEVKDTRTRDKATNSNEYVYITEGTIDNVRFIGYDAGDPALYNNTAGYSPAVKVGKTAGSVQIFNSYFEGGRHALVVEGGSVYMENCRISSGSIAGLSLDGGSVTLNNCSTDASNKNGIGIRLTNTTARLHILGTLVQYNWMTQGVVPQPAKSQVGNVYSDTDYTYEYAGKTYVNMGIVYITDSSTTVTSDQFNAIILDERENAGNYKAKYGSQSGYSCHVYLEQGSSGTSEKLSAPGFAPSQYHTLPVFSFDFTTKNYKAKEENDNNYCYRDSATGIIKLSFDKTTSETVRNWDPMILSAKKYGYPLQYTVTMNGTDYTNKMIPFSDDGSYEVIYTITDPYDYIGEGGAIEKQEHHYEKTIKIDVNAVEPEDVTYYAEFSYDGTWKNPAKKVVIGTDQKTYVMPDVAATSSTIGSTTVEGQTVYYPIVTVGPTDSGGNTAYSSGKGYYFAPVFNAINIKDYNQDTGAVQYTYNKAATTWPHGKAKASGPDSAVFGYASGAAYTNQPYARSMNAQYYKFGKNNNGLCYTSTEIEKDNSASTHLVQYHYVSTDGTTYYWYIQYSFSKMTYDAGSCLAAGTLITLADGTQKPVEAITMDDSVLAFNHETGELEPANIIFIEDDGVSQYNVINLSFSDGTVSRLIYEHGYFDLDEMQYVYITEANCRDYIGHHFARITEGETGYEVESVELVDAYVTEETTGCYSFPSAYHLNVIADGLLSMPGGIEGMFNIFAYDEDLKYDADAMARDIETYGLLTYDDFADVISYEEYAMYPAPYLGVSLGKGLMTQEQLSYLIERYVAAKR